MDFDGKRALVVGGTSGIGEGVVRALLDKGAHVVCSSRTKRNTPEDAEQRGSYHFLRADARDAVQLAEMVRHAGERLGGLDLVVHSIGGGCSGSVLEVEPSYATTGMSALTRTAVAVHGSDFLNCIHEPALQGA